jgi:broad specificity phosphatase PhoE
MKIFFRFFIGGFIAVAAAANAQQAVFLARHAELVNGQAMAEPKNLPLSETGEARAKRLAEHLKDVGINAIIVTDFVRTNKTAEPLARALNIQLTVVPKGDPKLLVERLRKEHANDRVLIVGHTDTLPGLIAAFGHPSEIKIESQDYGNLFLLVPKNGEPLFTRLRY